MKCCDITSGMLKTAVEFQRETKTADGSGGFTKAWVAISGAQTRAHVKAMSGGERWASERTEAQSSHKVTCRYFSGLTEKDRVEIGGRAHNITFIDNVEEANKWLVITVMRGAAT